MLKFRTDFTVVGRGTFPLDMLRHDRCSPRGPEDAAALAGPAIDMREIRRIRLVTFHESRDRTTVTPERWLSFGWSVDPQSIGTMPLDFSVKSR